LSPCHRSSLRRHSFSAPSRLCIERLDTATRHLNTRVKSLSRLVSSLPGSPLSRSLPATGQAIPNQISPATTLSSSEDMGRTCHGCHAPLDEDHQNVPSGWQKCPLEHWNGCEGGIVDGKALNGADWKGCPLDYLYVADESDGSLEHNDDAKGLDKVDFSLNHGEDNLDDVKESLENNPKDKLDPFVSNETADLSVVEVTNGVDVEHEDEEDILRQLEAANNLLKQQAVARAELEKAERGRRIELLKAENIRLSASMSGDIGGARKKTKQDGAASLQPHPKNNKKAVKKIVTPGSSEQPSLQQHKTRIQLRDSEYRPEEESIYSGLNIKGIRKIPAIQSQVESLIALVQQQAPSLDTRPSFVPGQPLPVPSRGVKNVVFSEKHVEDNDVTVEQEFVYEQLSDGTMRKVKVVPPPSVLRSGRLATACEQGHSESGGRKPHRHQDNPDNDDETSSDDDFDEEPRPGYIFRWRRDDSGEKYNVEELLQEETDMVYKYVKDDATGRSYKRLVMRQDPAIELIRQWVVDPNTGKKVQMLVPRVPSLPKARSGQHYVGQRGRSVQSPGRTAGDQNTGFVTPQSQLVQMKTPQSSSFPPHFTAPPADDKQGKIPGIVNYARICPINWTNKVTSDKLNMGLWCWAFIAELLATRTGQAPTLPHGELEARLRHYLNVLEIALQPGSSAEFDNHAWRVARLYAEKVQQKVDRGETWLGFEVRYGSDSQPHELMAAEKELAPKIIKKSKEEEKVKPKDDKRRSCATWNTSSVDGKCEYEVQNEGRSCIRRHECSWCKEKGKKSLGHQRSFCRQRISAGEQ
jgi:hypothetical protein